MAFFVPAIRASVHTAIFLLLFLHMSSYFLKGLIVKTNIKVNETFYQ